MEFAEAPANQSEAAATETETVTTETQDTTTEEQSNQTEPTTETTETPVAIPETTKQAAIKVKYNKEEKEIPYDEAPTWIQKGLNYDKVSSKLAERDAEVARRFGAQGINTWEQLLAGWDTTQQHQQTQLLDQKYQATANRLAEKWGADPATLRDIAQELANSHPAVQRLQQLEQENGQIKSHQQTQERINQDVAQFKAAYPELDYSTMPQDVWDRLNKGYSLTDSYQIHENKALKEKIAAQEQAIQAKETNKKNATNSPGSVTGQGATVADYISAEAFEKNKGDQRWVIKNLSKIQESRKKWK
jgi:hypothetical protein